MKSHTEDFTINTTEKRLIHHDVFVPIAKGRLDLGTVQRVFDAELDGQRSKRLIVKVLGL